MLEAKIIHLLETQFAVSCLYVIINLVETFVDIIVWYKGIVDEGLGWVVEIALAHYKKGRFDERGISPVTQSA